MQMSAFVGGREELLELMSEAEAILEELEVILEEQVEELEEWLLLDEL